MYRSTYADIDLSAIKRNMENVIKFAKKEYAFAVVKANAYGHGAIEVAEVAIEAGATHLAVATFEEALELRKEYSKIPILILGYTDPKYFEDASKYAITLTITNMEQIKKLSTYKEQLKIHFKVNTGMNRLGFSTLNEVREAYAAIRYNSNVNAEGIYTHFATADALDVAYYSKQYKMFEEIVDDVGKFFKIIHCQNSAATLYPLKGMDKCNAFRLGISLYGCNPSDEKDLPIKLEPTLELYSHVSNILELKKGSKIGYGATYSMKKDGKIATLPIGYADGIIRQSSGRDVCINGKRFPIVGRVCMDQLMILVDDSVELDDKVELIGSTVTLREVSKYLNTIDYEVLCLISNRVTRVYYEDSDEIDS